MLYLVVCGLLFVSFILWASGSFVGIFAGFPALCIVCFGVAYAEMDAAPTKYSSMWAFIAVIALLPLPFLIKQQAIAEQERRRDRARDAFNASQWIRPERASNRAVRG